MLTVSRQYYKNHIVKELMHFVQNVKHVHLGGVGHEFYCILQFHSTHTLVCYG